MISPLADLLVPPVCVLCQRRVGLASRVICRCCAAAIPPDGPPGCLQCGHPSGHGRATQASGCPAMPAVERARAALLYQHRARDVIHRFKYQGRNRIGRWLARRMAAAARRELPIDSLDLVVPVPLHWLKRRLRGASQSDQLARAVAHRLGLAVDPKAMVRVRWTRTQTRLRPQQRAANVRDAFRARPGRVRGRRILLIDDVLTSGATTQACAAALREAGATAVCVLAAARAI